MPPHATPCATRRMVYDRALVGDVVRRQVNRKFFTLTAFITAAKGKPSRTTVERVYRGEVNIEHKTLERIEHLLGLPRDFLVAAVATHDVAAIRTSNVDPDLRRWLLMQMGDDATVSRAEDG